MICEAGLGRDRMTRWLAVGMAALMIMVAGCSGSGNKDGAQRVGPDPLDGPAADVSEELGPGGAPFMGSATGVAVPAGYEQHEFVAAGTAGDYKATGELGGDGEWSFEPDTTADYRTRIVVRYPSDPARASGTAIIEWLNVSGGLDANPDYVTLESEIVRQGHIWVGVSAQMIGVEGGPTLVAVPGTEALVGRGLKGANPERYGSLHHPGDGYSFDIFTQIARAIRRGGQVTGTIVPDVVLAAGESQSAIALTTYYNGVQPLTNAFDGFFIHSRASVGLALVGPGEFADRAQVIDQPMEPTHLRGDVTAPVMNLQAEGDLGVPLESAKARQPDSATFRLWEVAGTSHADQHMLGLVAQMVDCGVEMNDGPMHVVAKAALASLDRWVRRGELPPEASRIEMTEGDNPVVARDGDGIALGGIRTAPVEVPVDVLSGEPGPTGGLVCQLFGSTIPLSDERLAEMYSSRDDYEKRYETSVDFSISQGWVLDADRDALVAYMQPDRLDFIGGTR